MTEAPTEVPNALTWLGHATTLIEVDGARILTDPLLRDRLFHLRRHGPTPTAHLGAPIDAVVISHLHHDHLDLPSLRALDPSTPIVVPAGAGSLLRRAGFRGVVELARGESWRLARGPRIEAVSAHHSGRRVPFGPTVEAAGYVIEGQRQRIYFAGDTGLFPEMSDLEAIDLALIPVGGWGPWLRGPHLDPRSAAAALGRIRPTAAVPIHWGTFWPVGLPRTSRFHEPGPRFAAHAAAVAPTVEVRVLAPGERVSLASIGEAATAV
ncbi:MAG: MBL fold metallo-hydrolase [Dehalococcoidia bacterium]